MKKFLLKIDHKVMIFINKNLKCRLLDFLMPIITYLGSSEFAIALCLGAMLRYGTSFESYGIKLSLSLIITGSISQIIKRSVNRIRPFLILNSLNIKKIGIDDFSFPSGHTTAAFTMAITTAIFFPAIGVVAIFLSSMVGVSRIYLGVHFPTDVVAGIIIGTIVPIILSKF